MTSPAERVEVRCPECGEQYATYRRASINLSLGEEWTQEELRQATTSTCPACGHVAELGALVIDYEKEER